MEPSSTERMYTYYLKKCEGHDINNPDEILQVLTKLKSRQGGDLSLSYVKGIICAIIWKLRQENQNNPVLKEYRYILQNLRAKLERDERNHSVINSKMEIPEWDTIINIRDDELKKGHYKNHLILSLYSYIPPRRIKDFILLKIATNEKSTKDTNYNYYDVANHRMIFNNYKTAKTYKTQLVTVPDELHDIIINYVKMEKIKNGDLLLDFHEYTQLSYALKKIIHASVDNLRHSYVNKTYEKFNIPSNEFMENLAQMMGHSLTSNLRYRKF
jgi:hypothetical protein